MEDTRLDRAKPRSEPFVGRARSVSAGLVGASQKISFWSVPGLKVGWAAERWIARVMGAVFAGNR